MGIDYSIHLGPYVECRTKKKAGTEKRRVCTNEKCKQHDRERYDEKAKFCEECGSKIEKVDFSVEQPAVDRWKISEKIQEAMTWPMGDEMASWMEKNNLHIWITNRTDCPHLHFNPKYDPFQMRAVTSEFIEDEIAKFKAYHEKELKVLFKTYGEENCTFKWGLLSSAW